MKKLGLRIFGIVFVVIIGFIIIINIPLNNENMSSVMLDCYEYGEDGNCVRFEPVTFTSENLNSIIDAQTVFTDVNENTDISLGSEKMVMVTKSILLDSNQKIVSNSTLKTNFNPATLLDLQKNVLDLGSVQLSFDLLYKKNAQVVISGEVEVLLDGQSKGKRYLSYSGQLPTNLIRLNVDKESRLLSERTQSLTFTLADEGKDWVDGSIHDLKIVLNKLDGQVISNGQVQNFEYGKELILYRLEMTVDQTKQVSFDENHNAVSVFKADGTLNVCSVGYWFVVKANGQPFVVSAPIPNINVLKVDGKSIGSISSFSASNQDAFSGKPYGSSYDECKRIIGIPRSSEVNIIVDGIPFNIKTDTLKPSFIFESDVEGFNFYPVGQYNGRVEYIEKTTSNLGYELSRPVVKYY